MKDEERIKNQRIATYFKMQEIEAHVTKLDGIFYNGLIKEVGADFFIIDDNEDGGKVIFFSELKRPIEQKQEDVK